MSAPVSNPPKCHDCKQPATTWVQFSYMVGRPEVHLCDACCNKEISRREQSEWKLPILMVPLTELARSPALRREA